MEIKNSIQLWFDNGSVILVTNFMKWNLENGKQWVDLEYRGNYIGHLHNFKFIKHGTFKPSEDGDVIKSYRVIFK